MHHVQVPGDIGRVLGRGPAGLLFGAGDEDGDTLVWVDLHAEIYAGTI